MFSNQIHLLSLILILATSQLANETRAATSILVGQPFPAVDWLPSQDTPTATHLSQVVLYDFWASWCPPCKASFPVMQQLVDEFKDQGFTVIAINEDEKKDKMFRFLKRHPVTFPVAHDEGHQLIKTLNVKTMPSAFLVDRNGIIHSVFEGFYGKSSEKKYREAIQSLLNRP